MQHRLFHTLVISSAVLLDGCATTHATSFSDAGPPTDAYVAPDAAADPRACEAGWPTTKGDFRHRLDGLLLRCPGSARVGPDEVDVAQCCVIEAEE